jgi:large subunit ribosomal protein L10
MALNKIERRCYSMPRPEKELIVQSISEKLDRARSSILTDYRGLNVHEITELRRRLTAAGIEYRVLKNTLTGLAAKKANIEGLDPYLEGPLAIAFGYDDPVAPAKIIYEFAKDHKTLEVKGAILDRKVIDAQSVKSLGWPMLSKATCEISCTRSMQSGVRRKSKPLRFGPEATSRVGSVT